MESKHSRIGLLPKGWGYQMFRDHAALRTPRDRCVHIRESEQEQT
jgi:hypothetical protein